MEERKSIALIGPMGCGKSSVGHLLGIQLNWPWVDLDEWIEKHENQSIKEIFDEKGEPYFRHLEEQNIALWTEQSPMVFSMGGGAPCDVKRWKLISDNFYTVFIDVESEVLINRLENERKQRPLIADKDDWKSDYLDLLAKRRVYYEQADFILKSDRESPEETTQRILDHVLQ
jgi:shikimate kinase